jgi:hypothetical protein
MFDSVMFKHTLQLVGDNVVASKVCSVTGEVFLLIVPYELFEMWKEDGRAIQEVFPMLDAEQREFLMTGVTPAEWEQMFSEEPIDNL